MNLKKTFPSPIAAKGFSSVCTTLCVGILGFSTLFVDHADSKEIIQESVLKLPHRSLTLSNGMKAHLIQFPSPGAVAYQLTVHAGSRNEIEKGKTGFAHFFEHLMFRGTKNRSAKDFGDLYVKLGCENNAFTSYDITSYHGTVASIYLPQILQAESDRFANLHFEEKALRDEAGAVLGEYNKDFARPESVLEEKLMASAFTQHPYGHTTMGYKDDILQFTERYKDVWPFFDRYYRPENLTLTLVGDFDLESTEKKIKELFGSWTKPKLSPVVIPAEPIQTAARKTQVTLDKPTQTRITVAYKIPAFSTQNKDTASLALLGELLFSQISEFQKEYRFKKKWLDSVRVEGGDWVDPGLWQISVRLSENGEGKETEILQAIEATLDQARKSAPTAERLQAARKRLQNASLTSWFSGPEGLAFAIAYYTNLESDLKVLDRIYHSYGSAKPQDLQNFAKKNLIPERQTTVILKGKSK